MKGIITLCGSTKFKSDFEDVNRRLTWSGWVVLSVGSFHHSEQSPALAEAIMARKVKLDKLHKEKIDLSQAIVVLNVGDYIGESTKSEIAHAVERGKRILWLEPHTDQYGVIYHALWTDLLDESPDDLAPTERGETPA